jgi:hypothetical protein
MKSKGLPNPARTPVVSLTSIVALHHPKQQQSETTKRAMGSDLTDYASVGLYKLNIVGP